MVEFQSPAVTGWDSSWPRLVSQDLASLGPVLGLHSQLRRAQNIPALLRSSPCGSPHSDSNVPGEPSFILQESSQHGPYHVPCSSCSHSSKGFPKPLGSHPPGDGSDPWSQRYHLLSVLVLCAHTGPLSLFSVLRAGHSGRADVVFASSLLRQKLRRLQRLPNGLRNFQ